MSPRLPAIVLAALLLPQPAAPQLPPASGDPDLARGIRQASDGLYEAAVITLDSMALRLATQPTRASELARANLYLGVALAGVGDTQRARQTLRRALAADPDIRFDSRGSQKSAAVFAQAAGLLRSAWREVQVEDARRQWSSGVAAPPASVTPVAAPPRPADAGKGGGGSKTALLVLGGAAVVGGGVAVAAGGSKNEPAGGTPAPATAPPVQASATFAGSEPPPGTTIRWRSGGREAQDLTVLFTVTSPTAATASATAFMYAASRTCFTTVDAGTISLAAGATGTVRVRMRNIEDIDTPACTAPFTITALGAVVTVGSQQFSIGSTVTYPFVR